MPVILSVTVKKRHITEVTLDNGAVLILDSDYALEKALHEGDTLSDGQTALLQSESDVRRARSRAVWYLSQSDYSKKALSDKLRRAGFSPDACTAAVGRMAELNLLDDEKLAVRLAQNYISANCSARQTEQKLILKGIPRDIARAAVGDTDADPRAQIRALIDRQYKNRLNCEDGVKKVFAALVRRGFAFGDIKGVLREYEPELDDCEEI